MRLSLQLYTVRDQFAADPVGTLRAAKDIGFDFVEGGGTFGATTAEEAKRILDDIGLQVSGAHVGLDRLEGDLDKALDEVKTVGCPFVIVPWVNADAYKEGWDVFGKRLEGLGRAVQAAGLTLAYHNHDFEFKNPGTPGLNVLFESASPELLKSELDVAWVQIGGGDPAQYIQELKDRLPLVHLKDFDPAKDPQWQPGGQGVVNWDSVLEAIHNADVQFGAVELDAYAGDPMDAARISYQFFESKGFK